MKRVFELILGISLLLMLFPVLVIVALAIYFKLGSPIVFTQTRAGYLGKPFKIYKFRTMSTSTDKNGNLLSDQDRLTQFGIFLRAYSLDELPQLFNVIKGDISLVGPRPLLPEYNDLYDSEQRKRLDVKPGITGWSQINGRNNLSWHEKFKLDVWYADNQSTFLDMKILFLTFFKVIQRKGISKNGFATTDKFDGNN